MAKAKVKAKTKARAQSKPPVYASRLKLAAPGKSTSHSLVDTNLPKYNTVVTQAASPTVTPFLTADQQQQLDESNLNYQSQLNDIDAAFAKATADAQYQTSEIERQRVAAATAATNSLIARGLFRSSIKDSDLADIDGAATRSKLALNEALALQSAANERARSLLSQGVNNMQTYMDRNAVENARAVPVTPQETVQVPNTLKPSSVGPTGVKSATELIKTLPSKPTKLTKKPLARIKSTPYKPKYTAMGKIRPVA